MRESLSANGTEHGSVNAVKNKYSKLDHRTLLFQKHCMTVFSLSVNCTKAVFLHADTEVRLFFKAALQYKDCSDTDKVYISKKGTTIIGWSAQSILRIV